MATWHWFPLSLEDLFEGGVTLDFDTDTFKCALLNDTVAPDPDTHDRWDDLSANEVSGTGYTAGGATLASVAVNYIAASNRVALVAADPAWTGATISGIRYAIVYKDTGTESSSPLLAYIDLGAQSVSGGTFTIDCDGTNGIVYIDCS